VYIRLTDSYITTIKPIRAGGYTGLKQTLVKKRAEMRSRHGHKIADAPECNNGELRRFFEIAQNFGSFSALEEKRTTPERT